MARVERGEKSERTEGGASRSHQSRKKKRNRRTPKSFGSSLYRTQTQFWKLECSRRRSETKVGPRIPENRTLPSVNYPKPWLIIFFF